MAASVYRPQRGTKLRIKIVSMTTRVTRARGWCARSSLTIVITTSLNSLLGSA